MESEKEISKADLDEVTNLITENLIGYTIQLFKKIGQEIGDKEARTILKGIGAKLMAEQFGFGLERKK